MPPARFLEGFSVFSLSLVFKHGKVGSISALGYVVVFHSLAHSTARLVGMGAVAEAALIREVEDFLEIA